MQTITNEQIYDRWEQVPESLKEAFFSADNGDIIWKACEELGISEDVAEQVKMVVGNIMLGFTRANDLADELRSIPGMDAQAIDRMIFIIDKRIFASIKADISKLYGDVSGTGPHMVVESAPEEVAKTSVEMGAALPMTDVSEVPHPVVSEQATNVDIRKVRIGEELEGVAPAMIHSEAELVPVAQKGRPLSSFGGMFGFGKAREQKKEGPAVTAEVTMIEGLGVRPQETATTEQRAPRVVHYTSAKEPEDIFWVPAQAQKEAASFMPIAKQEHEVDFEPKVIDLTHGEPGAVAIPAPEAPKAVQGEVLIAQPQIIPVPPMKEDVQAVVMKTPQRVNQVAQPPQDKEPRLADIPVSDDVIDLRTLERTGDKK